MFLYPMCSYNRYFFNGEGYKWVNYNGPYNRYVLITGIYCIYDWVRIRMQPRALYFCLLAVYIVFNLFYF